MTRSRRHEDLWGRRDGTRTLVDDAARLPNTNESFEDFERRTSVAEKTPVDGGPGVGASKTSPSEDAALALLARLAAVIEAAEAMPAADALLEAMEIRERLREYYRSLDDAEKHSLRDATGTTWVDRAKELSNHIGVLEQNLVDPGVAEGT